VASGVPIADDGPEREKVTEESEVYKDNAKRPEAQGCVIVHSKVL
jgi:hypothetical protein